MFIGEGGCHAAARRPIKQTELHQVRLVNFLDRILFFAKRGGERIQAHRAAGIFLEDRAHEIAVHVVKTVFVHAEHRQSVARHA